jgi:hypothetical protein
MKRYLIVDANGVQRMAYSNERYRVGQSFGLIGIVLVVYNDSMIAFN